MRKEDVTPKPYNFSLPPFKVLCLPHFDQGRCAPTYLLYTISANGVSVRRQISFPEVADGWVGLAVTLADHNKTMTEEDKERLSEFKATCKEEHNHTSAYGAPRTREASKYYVFSIKPKKG